MTTIELQSYIQKNMTKLPPAQLEKLKETLDQLAEEAEAKHSPKPKRQLGTMPDLVEYMAPDFDEPLEDFKDYMPE